MPESFRSLEPPNNGIKLTTRPTNSGLILISVRRREGCWKSEDSLRLRGVPPCTLVH